MGLLDYLSSMNSGASGDSISGLLGGSRPDMLQPIIGDQGLANARQNALLNLGTGMLAGSAWQPRHVSFNAALAQGLNQAQTAYQGSIKGGLEDALTAQKVRAGNLDYQQNLRFMDVANRMLGGPPQGQAQPGAAPGAQADPSAPATGAPSLFGPSAGTSNAAALPAAAGAAAPSMGQPLDMRTALGALSLLRPNMARGLSAGLTPLIAKNQVAPDGTVINLNDDSNIGANHGKLPDGMVMGPDGVVTFKPGFRQANQELLGDDARAKKTYDFNVPMVGPDGTPRMTTAPMALDSITGGTPPGAPPAPAGGPGPSAVLPPLPPGGAPGLPVGLPTGSPAPVPPQAAGAPPSIQTGMNPQQKILLEAQAKAFAAEQEKAQAAGIAAVSQRPIFAQNDALLDQAKPGAGAPTYLAIMKTLQSMGLASPKQAASADAIQQIFNNQSQTISGMLKSTFGNRVTNADVQLAQKTFGGQGQSYTAAKVLNGLNDAKAQQAQDYSAFTSNYNGAPKDLATAWQAHVAAQPSIWETPLLLNSGAIQFKQNAKGQTFAVIPGRGNVPVVRQGNKWATQ